MILSIARDYLQNGPVELAESFRASKEGNKKIYKANVKKFIYLERKAIKVPFGFSIKRFLCRCFGNKWSFAR